MLGHLLRFAGVTAIAALLLPGPARALERVPYELELLVDGVPLETLPARDRTYVEALRGREYSIRLTNRTPERIAVALAVDGLNTIDAKRTPARAAAKWILGPYASVTLDGWQTGPDTARRFFFTTEEESYGAWLGRTENLGLISAAVFRERRPVPIPIQRPVPPARKSGSHAAPAGPERESVGDRTAPRAGAAEPGASAPYPLESLAADELAATGIGREVGHSVRTVPFEAESSPAAVLELRYEYRDALVRLGVLPRPGSCLEDALERRERARGFAGLSFAPDPFR